MAKNFNIVALGESLIDFTPNGVNELGMDLFAKNPGGAPSNVLAMATKLGSKTAFIGKVGEDSFGDFLIKNLQKASIDTAGLVRSKEAPTTLAFVELDSRGDRKFSFYRKPGADICLQKSELDLDILCSCDVFHFGSVSLTDEPVKTATLKAVEISRKNGATISYDPNYREFLWDNKSLAKETILSAMKLADIVKVSEEELTFLLGKVSLEEGSKILARESGAKVILITRGEDGTFCRLGDTTLVQPTFKVEAVDTTGAGDAFLGALLHCLVKRGLPIEDVECEEWISYLRFANIAGTLTTLKKGAIPAMPSLEEIKDKLSEKF